MLTWNLNFHKPGIIIRSPKCPCYYFSASVNWISLKVEISKSNHFEWRIFRFIPIFACSIFNYNTLLYHLIIREKSNICTLVEILFAFPYNLILNNKNMHLISPLDVCIILLILVCRLFSESDNNSFIKIIAEIYKVNFRKFDLICLYLRKVIHLEKNIWRQRTLLYVHTHEHWWQYF